MPAPKTEYVISAKDKTAAAFRRTERNMSRLSKSAMNLKRNLTLVGLATGGGVLGRDLINAGQRMEGFRNALTATEGSAAGAQSAITFLREESDRLGLVFEKTVKSYTKFSAASKGTIIEGQKGREIYSSFAEAVRVLNLSADDMEGTFRALEQMLNKGTVQAEELRGQLGERLPGAFRLAAEAMGVTTEELGDMLKRGEILAEDLLPKLAVKVRETYAEGLPLAVDSAAASIARFENAFFDLRVAVSDAGAMQSFANTLDLIAMGMERILPHIPVIVSGIGTLSKIVAVGGTLYVGMVAYNAALALSLKLITPLAVSTASYITALVAGVGPVTLFTTALRGMAAATWANIKAFGILNTTVAGVFAVFSGVELGKWVNNNFPQVNIAIDTAIGKVIEGISHIEFFGKASVSLMKSVVVEAVNGMLDKLRTFTEFLSNVADKVGIDSLASKLSKVSVGINEMDGGFEQYRQTLEKLKAKRDEDIELTRAATESINAATRAQMKFNEAKASSVPLFVVPESDSPVRTDASEAGDIEKEFNAIRESLLTKERAELESYQRRLIMIDNFAKLSQENEERARYIRERETIRHLDRLREIEKDSWTERQKFENASLALKSKTVFGELAELTQGVAQHNRALFEINKVAGIANAIISAHEGAAKSLAKYPWPLAGAMAGAHLVAGLARVQAIRNTSFTGGGIGTTPSSAGTVPTVNNNPVQPINSQPESSPVVQVIVVGGGSAQDVDIDEILEAMTDAFNQDRVIIEPNTRQAQELAKVASNI